MIHFLNFISIYWHPYMHTVQKEHWTGFYRKKFLTIGRFTFWIRYGKTTTPQHKGGEE